MKKIIKTALVVLATVLTFAGCQKKNDNQFVLGLDDAFPPFGFHDKNGDIVGYDIDLAKEVCKRLDKKLVLQPIDWNAKEVELSSHNIDCIWNGFTMNDERKAAMAFTRPYLNNAQVAVVREGSTIKTLAGLKGKKVGVQTGSSAIEAIDDVKGLKDGFKSLTEFEENITALNDLSIGNLDAVVLDETVAAYLISTSGKKLVILDEKLADEEYGIAFAKDRTALRDEVQKTLVEMEEDGTVEQISLKWFGKNLSVIK